MKETLAERKLERIDAYDPDALRTISVNYHPRGRILSYHTHDFYEINYVLCGFMQSRRLRGRECAFVIYRRRIHTEDGGKQCGGGKFSSHAFVGKTVGVKRSAACLSAPGRIQDRRSSRCTNACRKIAYGGIKFIGL